MQSEIPSIQSWRAADIETMACLQGQDPWRPLIIKCGARDNERLSRGAWITSVGPMADKNIHTLSAVESVSH